jgi:hypothetical protein
LAMRSTLGLPRYRRITTRSSRSTLSRSKCSSRRTLTVGRFTLTILPICRIERVNEETPVATFTLDPWKDKSEAELRADCRRLSRAACRYGEALLAIVEEDYTAEQMRKVAALALRNRRKPT